MAPSADSHGVNTDPLWYYAAVLYCPALGSTAKRGWVEGFVACLGLLAEGGDEAEVLLETIIRVDPKVEEALGNSLTSEITSE